MTDTGQWHFFKHLIRTATEVTFSSIEIISVVLIGTLGTVFSGF